MPGDFRLLVGLGNPGLKYKATRHNIGFMVLEKLALKESIEFRQHKKLQGRLAEISFRSNSIRLLMPNTYMNESGLSIRSALDWFGLETNQLLILVDDMDLPLGRIRLREKGGSGGHNGLKSTIQQLGTESFCRIRIGIGAPTIHQTERKAKTTSHVLGRFNSNEIPIVDDVINEVIDGLSLLSQRGVHLAANQLNSYKHKLLEDQE